MTCRAAVCLLLSVASLAADQVFLDDKKASEVVLRGCDSIEREEKTITAEDRAQLEKTTGLRFPLPRYTFVIGKRKGAPCYAVIMNEIGKSEPITFMVGVDPEGRAGEIALMVFRESRGAEVREPRFTRQFKGKRLRDPIRINQDILNYTGATLSSEAMARGVKKALALVDHFYLKKKVAGLFTRAAPVMGTIASVKLYAESEAAADAYAAAAFAELRRLEDIFTSYRDSELTRLNAAAAERPVKLSADMFELVSLSIEYARKYAGAFDPAVGPAVRAWGFLGGPFRIPGDAERNRLRQLVGIDGLELDPKLHTLRFRHAGMELDFGGIAKGYAAEKVARLLASRGVERAIVNLGESSLFALGPPPGRNAWPVALRDDPDTVLELAPWSALSTSSTCGRSFRAGGRTYGHLLDPATAAPVTTEASATAICASGAESEAAVKGLLLRPGANVCGPWLRLEVNNGRATRLRGAGISGRAPAYSHPPSAGKTPSSPT